MHTTNNKNTTPRHNVQEDAPPKLRLSRGTQRDATGETMRKRAQVKPALNRNNHACRRRGNFFASSGPKVCCTNPTEPQAPCLKTRFEATTLSRQHPRDPHLKDVFPVLVLERQHPLGAEQIGAVLFQELSHEGVKLVQFQAPLKGHPQRTHLQSTDPPPPKAPARQTNHTIESRS